MREALAGAKVFVVDFEIKEEIIAGDRYLKNGVLFSRDIEKLEALEAISKIVRASELYKIQFPYWYTESKEQYCFGIDKESDIVEIVKMSPSSYMTTNIVFSSYEHADYVLKMIGHTTVDYAIRINKA
jgi:hypothetical protein